MIYLTDGREDSEDKSYNKTKIKGKEQEIYNDPWKI
jgi:hypothetical protein